MDNNLKAKIESILESADNILFMKGDKFFPKCGFSKRAVDILNSIGAEYISYDILEDEEVRQGLKEYSEWPTYPQLYHKGELIGGCDIIIELQEEGELQEALNL